ncbi:MAG: DUF5615 family PIN-like protein [Bacteroidota bacterium]|nr:DUF5615 family PIN-like protein [Bacteroidota bacterium]
MIIADENVEAYWIHFLRKNNFTVYSIQEHHAGISDLQVIDIVKSLGGLLLTEDKDFGELVFAHFIEGVSVLFLRYDQPQYSKVENQLLAAINLYRPDESHVFITVTQTKIRVRRL